MNSKKLLAIVMAALMFTLALVPTMVGATTTYPERVIKLLIVYEDSYRYFAGDAGIGDFPERMRQMVKLAEIPFKERWNITFDVTVKNYEEIMGVPYTYYGCDGLWKWSQEDPTKREWIEDGQCSCVSDEECFNLTSPGHHNCATRYLNALRNFVQYQDTYDAVACYVGHSLCYYNYREQEHSYCAGMSTGVSYVPAYVAVGIYDIVKSESQRFSNLLSNRGLLWHEFSHNFGLPDGNEDFTDPNNCTENFPCTMSGGYGGVVYAKSIWCPNCEARFQYQAIGSLVGGDN